MPGREVMPPRLQRLSTVCSYDLAICDHLSNDAGRPFSLSGMEKFIGLSSTNDFSRSIPNHWTTLSMTGWSLLMVRPVFLGGSCHRTPSSPLKKYERKHKVLASRWQYWTKLNIWGLHTLYIYIYIYIHIHVCVCVWLETPPSFKMQPHRSVQIACWSTHSRFSGCGFTSLQERRTIGCP